MVGSQPRKEGGTEVEGKIFVIIGHAEHLPVAVEVAGVGVRLVAIRRDVLIPIVERFGGRLCFNASRIGVFSWWLIEVTV